MQIFAQGTVLYFFQRPGQIGAGALLRRGKATGIGHALGGMTAPVLVIQPDHEIMGAAQRFLRGCRARQQLDGAFFQRHTGQNAHDNGGKDAQTPLPQGGVFFMEKEADRTQQQGGDQQDIGAGLHRPAQRAAQRRQTVAHRRFPARQQDQQPQHGKQTGIGVRVGHDDKWRKQQPYRRQPKTDPPNRGTHLEPPQYRHGRGHAEVGQ